MSLPNRKIVVSENNRRFEVIVGMACDADKVHVDCAAYDRLERRCDYAIRVSPGSPRHFFFVELKGNDVVKAAEQLKCAVENLVGMYSAYRFRQAWVVAGGWHPAVNTHFQVIQHQLKAKGFDLRYRTKTHSIDLTKGNK